MERCIGLRGEIYVNIGAYVRPNGMTPVRNLAQFMSGPYRIPHIHLEAHAYVGNKTPAGTYRGPGRYESCYFMERLIDLAATKLGIDRLELRRRNLVTDAEMPYSLATVLPSDGRAETSLDSGDHRTCFDRCVAEFDWAGKAHLQGRQIDGTYHGLGIACFVEGGASGPSEAARMEVEADGSVSVYAGSSAVGQGLETVLSQIAADALEISMQPHPSLPWLDDLSEGGLGIVTDRARLSWAAMRSSMRRPSYSNGSAASPPQGSA